MLSSCSPPVLFGHLPLPPPRGGSASRVSLVMIEVMIRILIEVGITYSSQDNQLPAVRLCLLRLSVLLRPLLPQGQDGMRLPLSTHPFLGS